MRLRLSPDPGPALVQALGAALEQEGLLGPAGRADVPAWRREALLEGVARERAPWTPTPGRPYVGAPSPRSRRGATRA